ARAAMGSQERLVERTPGPQGWPQPELPDDGTGAAGADPQQPAPALEAAAAATGLSAAVGSPVHRHHRPAQVLDPYGLPVGPAALRRPAAVHWFVRTAPGPARPRFLLSGRPLRLGLCVDSGVLLHVAGAPAVAPPCAAHSLG